MTWALVSYLVGVVALGLYCLIVLPTTGWRKVAGPSVLAVMYAAMLYCGFQAMGYPKPAWVELSGADEARLIAYQFDEGRAIYLWLQVQGVSEPIAYSLPWKEGQAAAVYRASQEAKKAGTPVMVQGVMGQRSKGDFKAYAAPVRPLPQKEGS